MVCAARAAPASNTLGKCRVFAPPGRLYFSENNRTGGSLRFVVVSLIANAFSLEISPVVSESRGCGNCRLPRDARPFSRRVVVHSSEPTTVRPRTPRAALAASIPHDASPRASRVHAPRRARSRAVRARHRGAEPVHRRGGRQHHRPSQTQYLAPVHAANRPAEPLAAAATAPLGPPRLRERARPRGPVPAGRGRRAPRLTRLCSDFSWSAPSTNDDGGHVLRGPRRVRRPLVRQ